MSRYQAYGEYKDSGVEWLGQIPDHWTCTQIKHGYEIALGKMLQKEQKRPDEQFKPYLKAANIQPVGLDLDNVDSMWFSDGEMKSLKLEIGDILISEGGDVGRAALWMGELPECYIQNAINRARPRKTRSTRFLLYWMSMLKGSDYIDILCNKATIAHYTVEKLATTPLFLPIDSEADAIANFLDHETAKIDLLIEKQQALIELLKEKRQAVISHAVTKGLNPNALMKDSGVEWLGEVPAHWVIAKLSFRYEVLLGKMLDDKKITGEYLAPYLRNTDVQWDRINTDELPMMDFKPEETERYSVQKGDLIVCEGGEIGRSAIWESDEPCFYQKALHRLRPINRTVDRSRFMFYQLFNAVHQGRFISAAGKSTIAHLPAETFRQYKFAFPPHDEQEAIEDYLNQQKNKFELLEQKAELQIQLFQERRTALISAAVTGKIDVRDWQT